MTLLESISKISEEKELEIQRLRELTIILRNENIELYKLLNSGEKLREQYVMCCAMELSPETIMKYVK